MHVKILLYRLPVSLTRMSLKSYTDIIVVTGPVKCQCGANTDWESN